MKRVLLALLGFYKRWLSPAVHTLGAGGCKFRPTCSEYAATAIALSRAAAGERNGPLEVVALSSVHARRL